ncbi:helix-turn-helix domain-containing protein [Aeromicrobium fastidiosum]|uniref:helix-turn-helix domain-containing protein n=1 Tax=Aeromicrobium fastidiosum TaxID=52699 RepID=UPI0020236347|nr:helix-turn-helix domain-containing protein [Aeromicrobium fastidiosum]
MLTILVTYADKDGGSCFPSREEIAKVLNRVAKPTVKQKDKVTDYLRELAAAGLIEREEAFHSSGRQTSNQYRLMIPRLLSEAPDWLWTPPRMEGGPPPDQGVTPPPVRGVHEGPAEAPVINQSASAEDGRAGPVSSDPESALAQIAALGSIASVDQVVRIWPDDTITQSEADTIRYAVSDDLFMCDFRELRVLTGIGDASNLAHALALARQCTHWRLDRSLSARQLLAIAQRVRGRLDKDRPNSRPPAPDGSAAMEWSTYTEPVNDVVKFISESILTALEQEAVKHGG